jgi:hypothetical protein
MTNLSFASIVKNVLKVLVALWIVFSLLYIGWSMWMGFRNNMLAQAYGQGVVDTVNQLIAGIDNDTCKPVPIFNKETKKEVDVVNAKCVKPTPSSSPEGK